MSKSPERVELSVNNVDENVETQQLQEINNIDQFQQKLMEKSNFRELVSLANSKDSKLADKLEEKIDIKKGTDNSYLLSFEGEKIGYVTSKQKLEELLKDAESTSGLKDLEIVLKESQDQQKELKKDIITKSDEVEIPKSVFVNSSMEELLDLYKESFSNAPNEKIFAAMKTKILEEKGVENFKKAFEVLGSQNEKMKNIVFQKVMQCENTEEIRQLKDIVGKEYLQKSIKSSVMMNSEFLKSYIGDLNNKTQVKVHGDKEKFDDPQNFRRVTVFAYELHQFYDGKSPEAVFEALQVSYGGDLDKLGEELAGAMEQQVRKEEIVVKDEISKNAFERGGLVGVANYWMSQTEMSPEQRQFWSGAGQLGAIGGLIYGTYRFFKETGWKGVLGLVGGEIALESMTGNTLFDLAHGLMYGGFSSITDDLTGKQEENIESDLEKGENSEEYKEYVKYPLFANMVLGDKTISQLKSYLKVEQGEVKWDDFSALKSSFQEDSLGKEMLSRMNQEEAKKALLIGLERMGITADVIKDSSDSEKEIAVFYQEYQNRMERFEKFLDEKDAKELKDNEKFKTLREKYLSGAIVFSEFEDKAENLLAKIKSNSSSQSSDSGDDDNTTSQDDDSQNDNSANSQHDKQNGNNDSVSQSSEQDNEDSQESIIYSESNLSPLLTAPLYSMNFSEEIEEVEEKGNYRRVSYMEDGRVYIIGENGDPKEFSYEQLLPEKREELEKYEKKMNLMEDMFMLVNAYQKENPDSNLMEKFKESVNDSYENPTKYEDLVKNFQEVFKNSDLVGTRESNIKMFKEKNDDTDGILKKDFLRKVCEERSTDIMYLNFVYALRLEGKERRNFVYKIMRDKLDNYEIVRNKIIEERFEATGINEGKVDEFVNSLEKREQKIENNDMSEKSYPYRGGMKYHDKLNNKKTEKIEEKFNIDVKLQLDKGVFDEVLDSKEKKQEFENDIQKSLDKCNELVEKEEFVEKIKEELEKNGKEINDENIEKIKERTIKNIIGNSVKQSLLRNFLKDYTGDDEQLKLLYDIEGINWNVSDKSWDVAGEIGEIIAIEAAALAVGAVTAGAGTALVNLTARSTRAMKGFKWMNRFREASTRGARATRFAGSSALEGALFYEGANVVHNVIEDRGIFEGGGDIGEIGKSIAFIGALKGIGRLTNRGILNIGEGEKLLGSKGFKLSSQTTIEGLSIGGIAGTMDVVLEGGERTVEHFIEGMLLAIAFRGMRGGINRLNIRMREDGQPEVVERQQPVNRWVNKKTGEEIVDYGNNNIWIKEGKGNYRKMSEYGNRGNKFIPEDVIEVQRYGRNKIRDVEGNIRKKYGRTWKKAEGNEVNFQRKSIERTLFEKKGESYNLSDGKRIEYTSEGRVKYIDKNGEVYEYKNPRKFRKDFDYKRISEQDVYLMEQQRLLKGINFEKVQKKLKKGVEVEGEKYYFEQTKNGEVMIKNSESKVIYSGEEGVKRFVQNNFHSLYSNYLSNMERVLPEVTKNKNLTEVYGKEQLQKSGIPKRLWKRTIGDFIAECRKVPQNWKSNQGGKFSKVSNAFADSLKIAIKGRIEGGKLKAGFNAGLVFGFPFVVDSLSSGVESDMPGAQNLIYDYGEYFALNALGGYIWLLTAGGGLAYEGWKKNEGQEVVDL